MKTHSWHNSQEWIEYIRLDNADKEFSVSGNCSKCVITLLDRRLVGTVLTFKGLGLTLSIGFQRYWVWSFNVNPSLCIFHDLLQEDQGAGFFINYTEETCT